MLQKVCYINEDKMHLPLQLFKLVLESDHCLSASHTMTLLDHFYRVTCIRECEPASLRPRDPFVKGIVLFYHHYWNGLPVPHLDTHTLGE